ncbi:MAG: hypothetical protein JST68_27180 [Bacteroidetes bacterium]|nr:hypothetical protein [Bacteroidota bacterium]
MNLCLKAFILSFLLQLAVKGRTQERVFHFISEGQLFVPAKNMNVKVDPSTLTRTRDLVVITLQLDNYMVYVEYLDSMSKNLTLRLSNRPSEDESGFDFQVIGSDDFKALHYIGGETKLISLETFSKDQKIYGTLTTAKADNPLVFFIKKSRSLYKADLRMEYKLDEIQTAYAKKDASRVDTSKTRKEDAIVSIDRQAQVIKIDSKTDPSSNLVLHYQHVEYGSRDGYKAFVFKGIDDPRIDHITFSIASSAFALLFKDDSARMYSLSLL